MLTRLVRTQLIVFTSASVISVLLMAFAYVQVPTLLGLGRMTIKVELPAAGGLYRFSNVTLRGVQIGKVIALTLTHTGTEATLSLDTSTKIPADVKAQVRSVSAVGEQYVDLTPRADSGPYLHDGSVIAMDDAAIPQPVGPMLDRVSDLVDTISKTKLDQLLDESYKGFNGAGYDLQSLTESTSKLSGSLNGVADQTRALIDDGVPLIDSQGHTTDVLQTWARSLAGITGVIAGNDGHLRTILDTGPGAINEASSLLDQINPTLPILLANLTTVGQVGVTYRPSLKQILVLLPPDIAALQTFGSPQNNPVGLPMADFALTFGDPPPCTVGFLPPSSWRSPADTTIVDTPDGLYCKLPQDSPIAVRGARNYPCMGHPGKRAPTVQICDSDQPYEPLAMRQHVLGPFPIDPNLISQGIAPDDRVDFGDRIYAPIDGTGAPPAGAPVPQEPQADAPPAPSGNIVPPPGAPAPAAPGTPSDAGAAAVAPSSFATDQAPAPSIAVAHYNPRTGGFITPDRKLLYQTDLRSSTAPKTWMDLMPT